MRYGDKNSHSQSIRVSAANKKLPFGFVVQNDRMELHKVSTHTIESVPSRRSRPDSAQVALNNKTLRINQLQQELEEEGAF